MKKADASHPEKKAIIVYDEALVTVEQMQKVLFKSGYVASCGDNEKSGNIGPILEKKNEFQSNDLVCFCFEYTQKDLERDYIENRHSTIMAKIAAEKKAGGCDCAIKNPKGR